jgi:DNA repair protein RAD16
MARATRQSARLVSKSSDTATPTSNASPYFSSRPESLVTGAETPVTSDVEGDANEKAPSKNKRVAEVASDDEYSGNDNAQAPPAKRRAIANRSYVVLERRTSAKGKEKVLFYPYFVKKKILTIR